MMHACAGDCSRDGLAEQVFLDFYFILYCARRLACTEFCDTKRGDKFEDNSLGEGRREGWKGGE